MVERSTSNDVIQDEDLITMGDEEEEGGENGSQSHHTLRLAKSIALKSEIFCLTFSDDGRFLLACCGDGIVRVFNPHTGVIISVLVSKRNRNGEVCEGEAKGRAEGIRSKRASSILDGVELPCTCAAFRPHVRLRERTSGVALIGYSHGEIQLWHVPSAKLLHRQTLPQDDDQLHSWDEAKERGTPGPSSSSRPADDSYIDAVGVEVLCCAYAGDGDSFAVGSSDGVVRVYSDSTKEVLTELKPGVAKGSGHSSRIFSVKFHPDDPNVIVSGGWDNCVHVWDVKEASTVRTVFGPHVCGDAIDVVGSTILTGSWRDDSQLETWDLDTGEARGPAFWSGHGKGALLQQGGGRRCRLYAAAFGGPEESRGKFIAAGGGEGANEVKVFDFWNDRRLIGSLLGLSAGVISLAFGHEGKQLAVGLADGQVHLVNIEATTVAQASNGGKTIMVF